MDFTNLNDCRFTCKHKGAKLNWLSMNEFASSLALSTVKYGLHLLRAYSLSEAVLQRSSIGFLNLS